MAKRLSWAVRLERAEKRGKFTDVEVGFAKDSWLTCAVGEKHGWAPNYYTRTEEEERLGMAFAWAVNNQELENARSIYQQIQELPA